MNVFKKFCVLIVLLTVLCSNAVFAESLSSKIILPNTNLEVYFNLKSVMKSGAVKDLMKKLPKPNDSFMLLEKALAKYNFTFDDFNEFALSLGLKDVNNISLLGMKKENMDLVFGISMTKQISTAKIEEIIKNSLTSAEAEDVSIVKYKNRKFVKIGDINFSLYFISLPEEKLIIGGFKDSVLKVLNRTGEFKKPTHPLELPKLRSIEKQNYDIWLNVVFPKTIFEKILKNAKPKNIGSGAVDPKVLEKIIRLTMGIKTADNIFIDVNTYFSDEISAQSYCKFISKHYIPLFKSQFLELVKGKPFPFLNKILVSFPTKKDVHVKYKITRQDISTFAGMYKN